MVKYIVRVVNEVDETEATRPEAEIVLLSTPMGKGPVVEWSDSAERGTPDEQAESVPGRDSWIDPI